MTYLSSSLRKFSFFVFCLIMFLPVISQGATPQVAAGYYHTVGLKSDGTVVAVGDNSSGQCNVSTWTDIVQVATGDNHTIGLKSDGTVVAVGDNSSGQCNVSTWTDIVQVAAGAHHTAGLKSDGTVIAIGYNGSGQCNVSTWTDIVQIDVGNKHTVGLKSDGTVVAVGDNSSGQCNVSTWSDVIKIAVVSYLTVGLKSDGTVVAVGDNSSGQCNVSSWTDIVQVAAGAHHTAGLKSDGTVVAVGNNTYGQCNINTWTSIEQLTAGVVHTVGLKSDGTVVAVGDNRASQCIFSLWIDIAQLTAGVVHTAGLRSDSTVVALGSNIYGQCNVSTWTDIVQIAAGYHTVGLKSDGTVVAVGNNVAGQCNISSWVDIEQVAAGYQHTVGLKSDGTVVALGNNLNGRCNVSTWADIVQVAAWLHTVGLKSDGTVVAVGNNDYGQCNVSTWMDIVQVATGDNHTVGLKSDGSVMAVGNNSSGQCNVSTWTDIVQIAAGSRHTVSLKSDGTVIAIGYNGYGQCNVSTWTDIVQIDAGENHTVGLKSDGTIVAVGDNSSGQSYLANIWELKVGTIAGVITDLSTGTAISNAQITDLLQQLIYSDSDGSYSISLKPGIYDITYSKEGYQSITIYDINVVENEEIILDIGLAPEGPLNISTTDLLSAETGVVYNDRVRISGGTYPYTYSIAYGSLPSGLSLNTIDGTISGTPTAQGSYTFAIAVTDSLYTYSEREFTIEVTQPLEIASTSPLPRATHSNSYFYAIEATGGTAPYVFIKNTGTLPSGINLSTNGNLSGIPSTSGGYDFTIQVTDASDRIAEKSFHLDVDNPLLINSTILNDGIVGTAYSQSLSVTGGYGDYSWQVHSGTLLSGLSLNASTGVISGTPTQATNSTIVLAVTDQAGRVTYKDLTIEVSNPLQILTTALPNALINQPFSEAIRTSGGIGPYTFSYTGQLPAGLSLGTNTGIISGTPTLAGYTNVSIMVTDSTYPASQSFTKTIGIRVWSMLTITTPAVLPNAKHGVAINPIVLSAGGGPSPYTWKITGGYLPEGITLNPSTGELSGTPVDHGDFVFTVQVTDANSNTTTKEFFLHISGNISIVTGAVPDAGVGKPYSFTLEANGGLKPYNWRLESGTLPTGLSFNTTTGTIYGTPTTRQNYSFTIEVSDGDSPAQTAQKTFTIETQDELYIYTKKLSNGRMDEAYTTTITAALGVAPYSWQLASGTLPPGLELTSSPTVATLAGTPTAIGTYVFTLEVSDTDTTVSTATREYTVEIYGDVVIDTDGLPTAVRGETYTKTIEVSGGQLPYSWKLVDGGLPVGLKLNSTTGQISGITNLDVGMSSAITIRVTDAGNPVGFDEKEFVIYVVDALAITTESLPDATVGNAYQANLEGEGGLSPRSWYLHSGQLPQGMTLDVGTGIISGTSVANTCGTHDFTIRLEDAAPQSSTVTKAFSITVIDIEDTDCNGIPDDEEQTEKYKGDFNGDGNQDILWRNSNTGQVSVWLTNSASIGLLSSGSPGTVADMNWEIIGVGNFNSNTDSKSDLLWRNSQTGQVNVWLINGTAVLSKGTLGTVADLNWEIVKTGDFNADGNTDLLWRNSQTGQVNVWLTNPLAIGVSSKGTLGAVADTDWEIIGVGNFNSGTDTKTDLLWRNSQTGQVNVWLINGTAVLSKGTLGTVSDSSWEIIKTGDFNADSNTDLLWRNSQTGQVNAWLINPASIGVLSKGTLGTVADLSWEIIGLGSFNSNTDSKSDLLWRNSQTGQVNVWLINGTAVLSKGTLGTVSDLNWEIITSGNFNTGSNTDLLWRNSNTGQVNVWLTNPSSIGVSSKGTLGTVADMAWEIR